MSDSGYWVTKSEYHRLTKPARIEHAKALTGDFAALLGRMHSAGFRPQTVAVGDDKYDLEPLLHTIGKELNQAVHDAGPGTQAAERDIAAIETALDQFIRSKQETHREP